MADVEEVSDALAGLITGFLSGPLTGGSYPPLTGLQTDVFSDWPKPNELNAALSAGGVQVSVFTMSGAGSEKNRHQREWEAQTPATVIPTTVAIAGGAITFGGSITLPLNVAVDFGNLQVSYAAVMGETLSSLAANLATALILAGLPAHAAGATVTLANAGPVAVMLGTGGNLIRETAREEQVFQITIWAPTRAARLATSKVLWPPLMALDLVNLPDGSQANIRFMKSMLNDHSEVDNMYRRDIWFRVEFPNTETAPAWNVIATQPSTVKTQGLINPP